MKSIYFSDEHAIFRDGVRRFVEREIKPHADSWEAQRMIPRALWRQLGDLGYLGITYPESYGGAAADFFFAVVFMEEIARSGYAGLAAALGVHQFMATAHLARAGSEELKQTYLSAAIRGDKIGALAVTEPDTGSDVAGIQTTAKRDGDHYIVNGSKMFITNGTSSDFVTTAVKTGGDGQPIGISLIIIDTDSAGFSSSKLNKIGWHCSDTASMSFDQVRVPASNIIGTQGRGFGYLMESFQLERLTGALMSLGTMDACLEQTLAYMAQRKAFRRPVSRFQANRHRLADLMTELESVRQLTYHAAWLFAQGEVPVKECSMVKLKATELSNQVVDACLQFHGGYGYMEEYPVARMYRDSRVGTIVGGTSEIMREIIAKTVIDGVVYQPAYAVDEKTTSGSSV